MTMTTFDYKTWASVPPTFKAGVRGIVDKWAEEHPPILDEWERGPSEKDKKIVGTSFVTDDDGNVTKVTQVDPSTLGPAAGDPEEVEEELSSFEEADKDAEPHRFPCDAVCKNCWNRWRTHSGTACPGGGGVFVRADLWDQYKNDYYIMPARKLIPIQNKYLKKVGQLTRTVLLPSAEMEPMLKGRY
jgi:hypothetical protein